MSPPTSSAAAFTSSTPRKRSWAEETDKQSTRSTQSTSATASRDTVMEELLDAMKPPTTPARPRTAPLPPSTSGGRLDGFTEAKYKRKNGRHSSTAGSTPGKPDKKSPKRETALKLGEIAKQFNERNQHLEFPSSSPETSSSTSGRECQTGGGRQTATKSC